MRNKLVASVIGALIIFGGLFPSSSAIAAPAAPAAGPVVDIWLDGGDGVITSSGYTSSWIRGTITFQVTIWRGSTRVFDHTWKCYSATSCSVNPSPIVLPCTCAGDYEAYAYAWGPETNGVDFISAYDHIIVSFAGGKPVFS